MPGDDKAAIGILVCYTPALNVREALVYRLYVYSIAASGTKMFQRKIIYFIFENLLEKLKYVGSLKTLFFLLDLLGSVAG